jgi:hypothetical protein
VEGLREGKRKKKGVCSVTYFLKARAMEPEKQSLLANGSENTFVSRQRLDKHVSAATDEHVTINVLLEIIFYTQSVQRAYKEDNWGKQTSSTLCGGGVEYLHRDPASRRRRRKGKSQI